VGSILPNYKMISEYQLKIIGEQYLKIQLNLIAKEGVKIEDLEFVHSHPMALNQCSVFLHKYPHIKLVERGDTASCVKNIKDNDLSNIAAVANEYASELYNVPILERNIENKKHNFTRFFVLSRNADYSESANKSSFCFRLKHEIGFLSDVLNVIKEEGLNLSKVESVPVYGEENQYFFYLAVEWDNTKSEEYKSAMSKIEGMTDDFYTLGEYNKASLLNS
jgi:prephenate dehydratase